MGGDAHIGCSGSPPPRALAPLASTDTGPGSVNIVAGSEVPWGFCGKSERAPCDACTYRFRQREGEWPLKARNNLAK